MSYSDSKLCICAISVLLHISRNAFVVMECPDFSCFFQSKQSLPTKQMSSHQIAALTFFDIQYSSRHSPYTHCLGNILQVLYMRHVFIIPLLYAQHFSLMDNVL